MKLHEYLVMILVFSLVVVVALSAVENMVDNYEDMGITVAMDRNRSDAFNKIDTIEGKTESIEGAVAGTDVGGEDSSITFLGGAWNAIQIVFGSLGVAKSLVYEIGALFKIPAIITTTILTIIIIAIVFTGIYMVMRHTGDS